jgi:type III pantothenate kinase
MYLLIDVGNTRIKWILVENSYDEAVVQYGSIEKLAKALVAIDRAETKILLSAVNQIENLQQLLRANGFDKIIVAKSQATEAGIVNSYEQPERMGVDRWLAMIASYQLQSLGDDKQGMIVVDAGSALTIDVLNQEGVHQGGYIVPGLKMAETALFSNTEQVKRYDESVPTGNQYSALNKLGNNTVQCVEYGVINQHVALIEQVTRQYPEYKIMITGGDGDLLASFFPAATVDENLVLKGLWQVRN